MFTNTLRRLTLGILCLFLLTSLIFLETQEVAAYYSVFDVTIKTDRPLHQYTDIAAFLKGVKLIAPKKSGVKSFDYDLNYIKSNGTPVEVTSGKAKAGRYVFSIQITLYDDYEFQWLDEIRIKLNGVSFSEYDKLTKHELICRWELNALPRSIVTFDAAGGKPVPAKQYVLEGAKVKKPKQPAKKGYTFDGWWTNVPKNSTKWNFNQKLYQDLSLIAKWKALPTTTTTTTTKSTTTTTTTTTTSTTTSLETVLTKQLPIVESPTTTTELIEPTTTETTLESTTTSEAIVPDTSSIEPEETTLPSDEKREGGGFNLTILLAILAAVIFLVVLSITMYKLGQKKNK